MNKIKLGSIIRIKGYAGSGATTLAIQLSKFLSNNIALIDLEQGTSNTRLNELGVKVTDNSAVICLERDTLSTNVTVINNLITIEKIIEDISSIEKDSYPTVLIVDSANIFLFNYEYRRVMNKNEIEDGMKKLKEAIQDTNMSIIFVDHLMVKIRSVDGKIESYFESAIPNEYVDYDILLERDKDEVLMNRYKIDTFKPFRFDEERIKELLLTTKVYTKFISYDEPKEAQEFDIWHRKGTNKWYIKQHGVWETLYLAPDAEYTTIDKTKNDVTERERL